MKLNSNISTLISISSNFISSIIVKEDTLTDMVSCMSEGVGLVHQMPFACDRTGIPATLEKVSYIPLLIDYNLRPIL
jgi:hypothetical protein